MESSKGYIISDTSKVLQGDNVILLDNKGTYRMIRVKNSKQVNSRLAQRKIKIMKLFINTHDLINLPYGGIIDLQNDPKNKQFAKIVVRDDITDVKQTKWTYDEEIQIQNDNRNYTDSGQAQNITPEQIEKMKKEVADGSQIIEELVKNSQTFQQRSQFSQEKYLKKKQAKYQTIMHVMDPSPLNLCQYYFQENPERIQCLRPDTLSLLVTKASPAPVEGYQTLVIENTSGLVTGAVCYRLQGAGHVTRMGVEDVPIMNINTQINIMLEMNQARRDNLSYANYQQLLKNGISMFDKTFHSCILCHSNFTPLSMFKLAQQFLMPGCHVAVYTQFVENLMPLIEYLKETSSGIMIQIDDLILREWQVLPKRTHPTYGELGSTGYVMSFDYVQN